MIYPIRINVLGASTEAVYPTYWIGGIITVTTRKLKTLAMVLHPDKLGLVPVGWASEWHCGLLALAEPKIERCCNVILLSVFFAVRLSGDGKRWSIRFLRNCPPTPPLTQNFALSENTIIVNYCSNSIYGLNAIRSVRSFCSRNTRCLFHFTVLDKVLVGYRVRKTTSVTIHLLCKCS